MSDSTARDLRIWVVCGLLVLAVGLVFSQTLAHDFVNWDDDLYVYGNPHVMHGLSVESVAWAFSHRAAGNWHPLTWISLMLDCQAYGLWAGGHHLTNVLLHAATALGLFLVLMRMTGCLWRSALVAAVFAIHPLRAESVAWAAERKDVLAGLFFVLTLWAYAAYASRPFSMSRYLLVAACLALGLMAKPMLVTLPAVLLLLDYWPLERLGVEKLPFPFGRGAGGERGSQSTAAKSGLIGAIAPRRALTEGRLGERGQRRHASRAFLEKLPLLAIAGLSCMVTLWAQQEGLRVMEHLTLSARLADAAAAYVAYLGKFSCPIRLAAFYPIVLGAGLSTWGVATACGILAGISAMLVAVRRSHPYLLVGWLWYLGMLVPVIGIVQVAGQAMADRYAYLPQIGLTITLVWGGADVLIAIRRTAMTLRRSVTSTFACLAVVGILAGLMVGAWRQTACWRSSETLWTQTLASTTYNYVAHERLGEALTRTHRFAEAAAQFRQSLQVKPDYAVAHCELGSALFHLRRLGESIEHSREALRLVPDSAEAHNNLGLALFDADRRGEALEEFRRALEIEPEYVDALGSLGNAMTRLGRPDVGSKYYERALRLQPGRADIHSNLGNALTTAGRLAEAIEHCRTAVQIKPDYAEAYYNWGNALFDSGRAAEAVDQYEHALQLRPDYAEAHCNAGLCLTKIGRRNEAIEHLKIALRLSDSVANKALVQAVRAQLRELGTDGR